MIKTNQCYKHYMVDLKYMMFSCIESYLYTSPRYYVHCVTESIPIFCDNVYKFNVFHNFEYNTI